MTIERSPGQKDVVRLRVQRAAIQIITPETWTWQICSKYWRLYYNDSEGAELRIQSEVHPLRPRRMYLIPAATPFACICHRPVDHLYVHFDLVSLPSGFVRDLFPPVIELPEDPSLESALQQLARGFRDEPEVGISEICQVKAVVYQALSLMFRDLAPAKLARCVSIAQATNPVTGALYYIEDNLAAQLDNRGLSRACGLSESHFIRTFRAVMGQTPAQYILDRRVAQAEQRLLYTGESIDQIAQGCGFPNRSYFTRVFTQRMGTPPAAFRRNGLDHPGVEAAPTSSSRPKRDASNAA